MPNILITGGSGLIGDHLTTLLQLKGYTVAHLSRKKKVSNVIVHQWNPETGYMEDTAIAQADFIIHLAGANVGEHRWTKRYKEEILQSRIRSTELLYASLHRIPNKVKAIIASSAIGYYGNRGDDLLQEDAIPAHDFLGATCVQWEKAVTRIKDLDKRVVILRTGIVLAKDGGALPRFVQPLRFGIAPVFGSGRQYYPWIHITDLCNMYLHAVTNVNMTGIYNAVSPSPVRYIELLNTLAKTMNKKKINIPVPAILLQVGLGEFAQSLTMSTRCSADSITGSGFVFQYPALEAALQDLMGRSTHRER